MVVVFEQKNLLCGTRKSAKAPSILPNPGHSQLFVHDKSHDECTQGRARKKRSGMEFKKARHGGWAPVVERRTYELESSNSSEYVLLTAVNTRFRFCRA